MTSAERETSTNTKHSTRGFWIAVAAISGCGFVAAAMTPVFGSAKPVDNTRRVHEVVAVPVPTLDASQPEPNVVIHAPSEVDLGLVGVKKRVATTISIHNPASKAQDVEAKPSCGCTVASIGPNPIPPGGTAEMRIELTAPETAKKLRKRITLKSSGSETPHVIQVTAQVHDWVSAQVQMSSDDTKVILSSIDGTPFRILGSDPDVGIDLSSHAAAVQELRLAGDAVANLAAGQLLVTLDHPERSVIAVPMQRDVARPTVEGPAW